jgi:hypothetical protein
MFLYEAKLLKAGVAEGVLEAQFRMVRLYTTNLNAVGSQAAFIAAISYLSIQNALIAPEISVSNYALISQILYAIGLISALIMTSHCVLASMLGPTKALVGNDFYIVPINTAELIGVYIVYTRRNF